MLKYNISMRFYLGILLACAVGLVIVVGWLSQGQTVSIENLLLLLGLACLAEFYSFSLSPLYRGTAIPTVHLAAILLLNPLEAIIVAFGSITLYGLIRQRNHWFDFLYGIIHRVFIVALPAIVVDLGSLWFDTNQLRDPRFFGLTLVAICLYHATNIVLTNFAVTLTARKAFRQVWKRHTILIDLTLPALGVLLAIVWLQTPLFSLLLLLPVALNHFAFGNENKVKFETHQAIVSLTELIETHDSYTFGHSLRVSSYCRAIAKELKFDDEQVEQIALAGRVHDIGKIGISEAILRKPGKLDATEWLEMSKHPSTGAQILANYDFYVQGVQDVLHHHESWDGSGYPTKLSGEAIPLGARIIAVADSFDAMTTNRPYRHAMPIETAITILQERRNIQWDAQIVDAFVIVIERSRQNYPEVAHLVVKPAGVSLEQVGGAAYPLVNI